MQNNDTALISQRRYKESYIFFNSEEEFRELNSQLSSIRMKSLIPKFSRKTPEDEVVLKKKEMSALSSPWKVGKWRYEVSFSKNAEFQRFSAKTNLN